MEPKFKVGEVVLTYNWLLAEYYPLLVLSYYFDEEILSYAYKLFSFLSERHDRLEERYLDHFSEP